MQWNKFILQLTEIIRKWFTISNLRLFPFISIGNLMALNFLYGEILVMILIFNDSNILEIHVFCICWTFANYCNCVYVCYSISFYFCSSKSSFYLPLRSSILPASRFQRYRRITRSQWNIADVLSLLLFCKRSNHI